MPKKETNKYFYIISVIVALLVIGITISASFAFFTNSGSANTGKATVITSGSLSLELVDGNVVGTTEGMVPGDSVTKTFIVRNTGTIDTTYDVYFSEVLNTFADKSDLVYSLTSSDGGYNTLSDQEVPSQTGEESKIINAYSINANSSQTYTLTIKFLSKNENQDDNKGKTFSGKLQINEYKDYEITYASLDTGTNINMLWKSLASNSNVQSWYTSDNLITSIKRSNSLVNTDNIISTQDSAYPVYTWYDNGTIYYYSEATKIKLNANSESMFMYLTKLNNLDFNNFDVSDVTSMKYMLAYTTELSNINFGNNFNTSSVNTMYSMFANNKGLEELDLSSFDTSSLVTADFIIDGTNIKTLNISNWNSTNYAGYYSSTMNGIVADGHAPNIEHLIARNLTGLNDRLKEAFRGMPKIKTIDITGIDTSQATTMEKMFYNDVNLESIIGLTDFDTSNVTSMKYMFFENKIQELDLSSFDTSNVNDMSYMFSSMGDLQTIYVGNNWYTSLAIKSDSPFNNCNSLVGGQGTTYAPQHDGIIYARVDEGESNPGYLTYKDNNSSNQGPVITYKYWNDDYQWNTYTSTSVPSTTYTNYTDLVTSGTPTVIARTTFGNNNQLTHGTCLYYNDKLFCLNHGYWKSITGSSGESEEGGQAVANYLSNEMNRIFNTTFNCSGSSSMFDCAISTPNGTAHCGGYNNGYVTCNNGAGLSCYVSGGYAGGGSSCYR